MLYAASSSLYKNERCVYEKEKQFFLYFCLNFLLHFYAKLSWFQEDEDAAAVVDARRKREAHGHGFKFHPYHGFVPVGAKDDTEEVKEFKFLPYHGFVPADKAIEGKSLKFFHEKYLEINFDNLGKNSKEQAVKIGLVLKQSTYLQRIFSKYVVVFKTWTRLTPLVKSKFSFQVKKNW